MHKIVKDGDNGLQKPVDLCMQGKFAGLREWTETHS